MTSFYHFIKLSLFLYIIHKTHHDTFVVSICPIYILHSIKIIQLNIYIGIYIELSTYVNSIKIKNHYIRPDHFKQYEVLFKDNYIY